MMAVEGIDMATASVGGVRKRVVILGAGFGGLHCAQGLKNIPVDVTVVDRKNYHTFQPLLYQVALAVLSPGEIAQPIRSILRAQKNSRGVDGRGGGVRSGAAAS